MFYLLVDTCVWLALAEDPKQTPLLRVLQDFIDNEAVKLLVPRIVHDEFHKNRDRVARASARSLVSHFQQVKEAVNKVGVDSEQKRRLLAQLDDVNHKVPLIGGIATGLLDNVAKMLDTAGIIETASEAKLRAAERALARKAPCHHDNKNSIADAMVIETYRLCVAAGTRGDRFAFVSHNKNDFSATNGSHKVPHPDIADLFTKIKSLYFVNLGECLSRVAPNVTRQLLWEYTFEDEPRGLTEIQEALALLLKQVWYNRHMNLDYAIKQGHHRLVTREEWDRNQDHQNTTLDSVWRRAVAARTRTERQLGMSSLGPWDDFEWGMINGKLSALRWVLGDEWDMLDT